MTYTTELAAHIETFQLDAEDHIVVQIPVDRRGEVVAALRGVLGDDIESILQQEEDRMRDVEGLRMGDVSMMFRRLRERITPPAGAVKALAHRLWSVHPREIQDMGITREQFYEAEINKLVLPVGGEAKFLLDRLEEYDPEDEDHVRDFHGHVAPAIARLRNAIAATPAVGGEALKFVEPPFSVYHNLNEIGDKNGHVCTAEDGDIAKDIVTALTLAAQPASPLRGREPIAVAADAVVERVNEYDDRTSPEDFPEALLITSSELHRELMRFAEDIGALAAAPPEQPAAAPGSERNWSQRDIPAEREWMRQHKAGEPIREDNYMSNDLDKGDKA